MALPHGPLKSGWHPRSGWTDAEPFGLLHLVALPAPVELAAAFLLMDLSFYYWHRLNHEVPFLWRFHNVHHFDPDLDVSTAFRFHFGEIALSAGLRVVQVVLPWWDRLHPTLGLNVPQAGIVIGVPGFSEPDDNRFLHALTAPFRRQREYWTRPDGAPVTGGAEAAEPHRHRLAE